MRPGHHWLCELGDVGNGTSCEKQFNLDHRKCLSARIIGAHASTIKILLSSSSADSTEWRRMRQDSRSKSGRRTLTHHDHLCLC
jgi:hypothetical protein